VQKLERIAAARHDTKRGLDPRKTNAPNAVGNGSAVLEEVVKRAKGGVLTIGSNRFVGVGSLNVVFGAYNIITSNSFATIDRMIDILLDQDIAMEFECYDVGHLYVLDHHLSRKNVKRPLIVQFLTGILGGIPSEIDHLLYMKRTAERVFGPDVELFTHGTGTGNIKAAVQGALMGTHVRVGQEDNLFEFPGKPFASNAAQVEKMGRIFAEFGLEMATPKEARTVLGLSC